MVEIKADTPLIIGIIRVGAEAITKIKPLGLFLQAAVNMGILAAEQAQEMNNVNENILNGIVD